MCDLTPATFSDVVGSAFTVDLGTQAAGIELVLSALEEHPRSPGAPRPQPFTLTFLGPAGQHLAQATYRFSHADLGDLDLFIVPRGPGSDGRHRYEAAFN